MPMVPAPGAHEADRALARGEVWRPFHGMPFALKDAHATAGMRTSVGFPPLDHVPNMSESGSGRSKEKRSVPLPDTYRATALASGELRFRLGVQTDVVLMAGNVDDALRGRWYRMVARKYRAAIASDEGTRRAGARYNPPGVGALYPGERFRSVRNSYHELSFASMQITLQHAFQAPEACDWLAWSGDTARACAKKREKLHLLHLAWRGPALLSERGETEL